LGTKVDSLDFVAIGCAGGIGADGILLRSAYHLLGFNNFASGAFTSAEAGSALDSLGLTNSLSGFNSGTLGLGFANGSGVFCVLYSDLLVNRSYASLVFICR
jgi:hypothetical protein